MAQPRERLAALARALRAPALPAAPVPQHLQELGWLRVLNLPMWHTGRLLSEDSAFGDVLHSFFGYSDSPTPLQLLVYVAYLAIVVATYLGLQAALRSRRKSPQTVPEA